MKMYSDPHKEGFGEPVTSNPAIFIEDISEQTVSMVLIAVNPDTEKIHWVVYNIPVTTTIEQNFGRGISAVNDFARHGFTLPDPDVAGFKLVFTLFCLDVVLNIGGGKDGNDILSAINGHILESTVMEYRYPDLVLATGESLHSEKYELPPGRHD
jgi:phosphatidylethanolamine-binding protein (PEBP) family uncharacterized protein